MSTKIYEAYRWTGQGGMRGVLDNLMAMRERVADRAVKNILADASLHAILIDKGGAAELETILIDLFAGTARDKLNFACSVCVFPGDDGEIYIKLCGMDSWSFGEDCPECFVDPDLWADFHYQNSVDRPREVSEDEWANRQSKWEKMFSRGGIVARHFSDACLVFHLIEPCDAYSLARKAREIVRRMDTDKSPKA